MHAADLSRSPRLQRTLAALQDNPGGLTTMEVIRIAGVCAVNSIAAELIANGIRLDCSPVRGQRGVYRYRLEEAA